MYACSPSWEGDWIDPCEAEKILGKLSKIFGEKYPKGFDLVGVNLGLHLTGGEPFLNYGLLLKLTRACKRLSVPGVFVETNCFWCVSDETTEEKLLRLKEEGLRGILISVNPFTVEETPFERVERAIRISRKIFDGNTMVYHETFLLRLRSLGFKGTVPLEKYLGLVGCVDPVGLSKELGCLILPKGRAPYQLGHLYRKHPAKHFFGCSCLEELTRGWHIHIDNYYNYITGYCAGISLGDARDIEEILEGVDLDDNPIIAMLTSSRGLERLYRFAIEEFGYVERGEGYVSKCHLCTDIRRHIVEQGGDFRELRPKEFYSNL
ncbi:MAG: hypothetical protein DRO11_03255 [Methanobacteriota archaeon]|nr:MAG: hypothetical protein DRO11_03255 [Euryarchaeota archaeon]